MSARDDIISAVHEGYECLDWAPEDAEIDALLARHVAEVERDDDSAAKQATLAELVAYRLQVIGEVTGMLRALPRYDRDQPAAVRVARRIEEWASQ